MIETSSVPPRKSSATIENIRQSSENVRRRSSSLRNNFGKSSEIFGKWSEIFGKWSKTSLLVHIQYLTRSLRSHFRLRCEHSKINSLSPCIHVLFPIYLFIYKQLFQISNLRIILKSIITCSEIGQPTAQSKKVYCLNITILDIPACALPAILHHDQ